MFGTLKRNARESYSWAFFMFYNIFLNIISKILALSIKKS